jgi:hypothetical protein
MIYKMQAAQLFPWLQHLTQDKQPDVIMETGM